MARDRDPLEPPGEDAFDLPENLGGFVAACTFARSLALALVGTLRRASSRARLRGLSEDRARPA